MSAAANVHGRPLMQLNNLARWYIRVGLGFLLSIGLIHVLRVFGPLDSDLPVGSFSSPLMTGTLILFMGAIGMKFLPSSLGSSPHIYSLSMALWCFWLVVTGTVICTGLNLFRPGAYDKYEQFLTYGRGLSWSLVSGGALLLFVNISQSIKGDVA
ncbi:MAG: hypothetical protein ABEJ65_04845 [bacterium]